MPTASGPRVLFVCAELFPLVKTGGLADVCAALPAALAQQGVDVRLLLPGYPALLTAVGPLQEMRRFGPETRLLRGRVADSGLPIYLFDAPALFARPGGPYQDAAHRDWPDNHRRFAAFSQAAAALAIAGDGDGWQPELVHVHDWHAALVPALLAVQDAPHPPSVLTIHNLAFQGNFPLAAGAEAGLPPALLSTDAAEFYGQVSFLKAGIRFADRLTTVSPTYARDILTPAFGAGLDGVLRSRADDLVGILNGIDTAVWDPAADRALTWCYDATELAGKQACKAALQQELGLEPAPDLPLVCFVNRLTHQKMADVVLALLPALAERELQFVLHGEGDPALDETFAAAAGLSCRAALCVGYQEALAHRIVAAADISLVPSRFEPCGLTAMYAMRYGALPVCRAVGGLNDIVVDAGDGPVPRAGASGFSFDAAGGAALLDGVDRACARFAHKPAWQRMQQTAMRRDFGWAASARRYLSLYRALTTAPETEDMTAMRRVA